jgi:hypothetical protein
LLALKKEFQCLFLAIYFIRKREKKEKKKIFPCLETDNIKFLLIKELVGYIIFWVFQSSPYTFPRLDKLDCVEY